MNQSSNAEINDIISEIERIFRHHHFGTDAMVVEVGIARNSIFMSG